MDAGSQVSGAAPIVEDRIVEDPQTIANRHTQRQPRVLAPRHGHPRRLPRGDRHNVTDGETVAAYHRLAREEGIFCEPASAAGVAGVIKAATNGALGEARTAVCIITGMGLKDPDSAKTFEANRVEVKAELGAIERVLA